MKLSQKQLRRLIEETINEGNLQELEPNPDMVTADQVASYFVSALSSLEAGEMFKHEFADYLDHAFGEETFLPARFEDVERMSSEVARHASATIARSSEFKEWLAFKRTL